MPFRTQLNIDKSTINIAHNHKIMLLGSCFSDNIGDRLKKAGFDALINPFGTVYNPISISKLIRYVSGEVMVSPDEIHEIRGVWSHPDFHSDMSALSRSDCYEKIIKSISTTKDFLEKTDFVFITLGTATAYWDKDSGLIVSNCQKRPAHDFAKVNIDIEQGQKSLLNLIKTCESIGGSKKYIFTVSPVRHIKDGIVENCRSKARLISMIENVTSEFPENTSYFPAYEWMMDDLRDYRFYEKDMIHPNEIAIDFIWEKFIQHYTSEFTKKTIEEVNTIRMALNHRPFNPDSEEHKSFTLQTENRIKKLKEKLPWVEF